MECDFITGTDTGVGKTHIATKWLHTLKKKGYKTLGLKPIASGARWMDGGLKNEDALMLQEAATEIFPYEKINPFCYEASIAPHIAAKGELTVETIIHHLKWIETLPVDRIVIEGAGGWLLPLNEKETMAEVVKALNWNVVLVVGMKLGCLNHAFLTYENILQMKCNFKGWIPNDLGIPMEAYEENLQTLIAKLGAPLDCD